MNFEELFDIIEANDEKALHLELAKNIDVNAEDNSGRTLLSFAFFFCSTKCVRKLLEFGADIHHSEALLLLSNFAAGGDLQNLQLLLEFEGGVQALRSSGEMAMTWAIKNGHQHCLEALIAGVSVSFVGDGEEKISIDEVFSRLQCAEDKERIVGEYPVDYSKDDC